MSLLYLDLAGDSLVPTRTVRKVIGPCERRSEFSRFCFYKSAYDFIRRFDPEFPRSETVSDFRCRLREKIFSEFVKLHSCDHSLLCHFLHPNWEYHAGDKYRHEPFEHSVFSKFLRDKTDKIS